MHFENITMQFISPDYPEIVDSETPGQYKALAAALPHENSPAITQCTILLSVPLSQIPFRQQSI